MKLNDRRKKSIYIPHDLLRELEEQAERLDRSDSWIIAAALRLSLSKIKAMPAPTIEVV